MSTIRAILGGLALATLTAGCGAAGPSPEPATTAAVSFGDGTVHACAPASTYTHLAYGQVLTIEGGNPATIRAVHFPGSENVRLGRVFIQQDLSQRAVGVISFPDDITTWPGVTPAIDSVVAADKPAILVLEVFHETRERGYVGDTEIGLTINGVGYSATAHNTLVIGQC